MRKSVFLPFFIAGFLLSACHPAFRSETVQYSSYRISTARKQDSVISILLKPFSDSINKSMNDVIGYNEMLLERKPGGSTLGYFMADAYLLMARLKFNTMVDAAFMNHGGIRLPELPAGNITRGKIYELMPFDNLLLLQKIKGSILKQYLDTLAASEGGHLAGITMVVKNKTAFNIMVGGKPLNEDSEYIIANSDYSINSSNLLKLFPTQNINYLQRDALIDYVVQMKQQGNNISVININRVTHAE